MQPTNLSQYYNQQGQALPGLNERAQMFESMGLGSASEYRGSASQNTQLLNTLQSRTSNPNDDPNAFGPNIRNSNDVRSVSAVTSNAARKEIGDIITDVNSVEAQPEQPVEEAPSERQRIQDALTALEGDQENLYQDYTDQLERIAEHGVKFSREERKIMDDIQSRFDILRRRQIVANQSLEQGLATSHARTGLARYGAPMAAIEIQSTAQQGIDRLRDIEIEAETKLRETREAITEGRIDAIEANYDQYRQALNDRRDTLTQLRLNLNDAESALNAGMTSDMKEYNLATQQGYQGSFLEYQRAASLARSTGRGRGVQDYDDILNTIDDIASSDIVYTPEQIFAILKGQYGNSLSDEEILLSMGSISGELLPVGAEELEEGVETNREISFLGGILQSPSRPDVLQQLALGNPSFIGTSQILSAAGVDIPKSGRELLNLAGSVFNRTNS